MGSPVSIGDAILLSQIAYNIGQAFTSGRKSAPAEFAEVQNLLFTLSTALGLVAKDLPKAENTAAPQEISHANLVLAEIVTNCRGVLGHLQALVDDYLELDPKAARTDRTGFKRWKDDFRKNWKKVKWTQEGGGLDKLKAALNVHITGLDLAVSALNKQQSRLTLNRVDNIDAKLDEIYRWFTANLQGHKNITAPVAVKPRPAVPTGRKAPQLTFTVWTEQSDSVDRSICCPRASFSDGWLNSPADGQLPHTTFQCHCGHTCHLMEAPCTEPQLHQRKLDFYLLPVSILVRLVEPYREREWQIYVNSDSYNLPVSLFINNVPPPIMADIEQEVNRLAVYQASDHLSARSNTMLVTFSVQDTEGIVSVLNMKAYKCHHKEFYTISADSTTSPTTSISEELQSASFTSGGRIFSPERIQSLQILHYRSIGSKYLNETPLVEAAELLSDQPYAELILRCKPSSHFGDEVSYIIRISQQTPITQGQTSLHIKMTDVLCIEEEIPSASADIESTRREIRCSSVELRFRTPDAVEEAKRTLQSLQRELWISYLRDAQWGEAIVLYRPDIGDVHFPPFHLPSACMRIVFNPPENRYRLILMSCCHSLSVCVELSQEYLEAMKASKSIHNGDVDRANVNTMVMRAWFVKIGRDGTGVFERETGVEVLLGEGSNVQRALIDSFGTTNPNTRSAMSEPRAIKSSDDDIDEGSNSAVRRMRGLTLGDEE